MNSSVTIIFIHFDFIEIDELICNDNRECQFENIKNRNLPFASIINPSDSSSKMLV
jgi:hypothetical protein